VTAGDPVVDDEKLYHTHGDESLSLNWRPATDAAHASMFGPVAGSATIDGDAAEMRGESDTFTVVGPARDGRVLALSASSGLSVDELRTLAAQVHRQ
jgi:hypothetical protein